MAELLYAGEGAVVLGEIQMALNAGCSNEEIALAQECAPQDIASIRAGLRSGHYAGAMSTARAIYGLRTERRQKLADALSRPSGRTTDAV